MVLVTLVDLGDHPVSMRAWRYGEWVAHRNFAADGTGWTVSYLPSASRLIQVATLTEPQACRLADWLDAHVEREELLDWMRPSIEVLRRFYQGIAMVTTDPRELDGWARALHAYQKETDDDRPHR